MARWEFVTDNTSRLKVPDGWLVRTIAGIRNNVAMTFVPDVGHTWEL